MKNPTMAIFLSILAVIGAILTGYMEWLGAVKSFYWFYPWFDIFVHIVGGLTIGLWGAAIAWPRSYTRFQAFFFILLLAIGIGSVWEIFEYMSGITAGEIGYWADTLKDLGDDMLGGLLAWVLYSLLY